MRKESVLVVLVILALIPMVQAQAQNETDGWIDEDDGWEDCDIYTNDTCGGDYDGYVKYR